MYIELYDLRFVVVVFYVLYCLFCKVFVVLV